MNKGLFDKKSDALRPLADLLRPQSIRDIVGQDQLLSEEASFLRMIKSKKLSSLILWGPPGTGKTSLARLLAAEVGLKFVQISAVFSGVADLKKIFAEAEADKNAGIGTLLFVDEIHRFNRSQQDGFLPYVESGTVTLVGATTENPSFELNSALLSRCQVFVLKRLSSEALGMIIARAETATGKPMPVTAEAMDTLKAMADGDARYLINMIEMLYNLNLTKDLDPGELMKAIGKRSPVYDKDRESHYNLISAVHKSLRGSDADAALYWVSRMIDAGEDMKYLLRRLTRFAVEDIGMAEPMAAVYALNAWNIYERLGSPEGDLAVLNLVVFLGTAPKSNAIYIAEGKAKRAAKETGSLMPPMHILNAPTKLMKELGYSDGYVYDHDAEGGFSGQNYFPDGMARVSFYKPKDIGFEREIKKRLEYFDKLRSQKP